MALTVDNVLKPLFSKGGKYDGKVKAVFRLQVQPWHVTSTLTHEAGLAVHNHETMYLRFVDIKLAGPSCLSRALLAFLSPGMRSYSMPMFDVSIHYT